MLSDRSVAFHESEALAAGVQGAADVVEVPLSGEIDLATRSRMVCEVSRHFGRGQRMIRVDLGAVSLLDASGIGACLRLQRLGRACDCDVAFANATGSVARVIHLLGLESVLLAADRP